MYQAKIFTKNTRSIRPHTPSVQVPTSHATRHGLLTYSPQKTGAGADDTEAWAAASALMAVHHGLLQYVRNAIVAGRRGTRLTRDAAAQASRALTRLESGLADYPTNPL
jgi:hypothetical protein